MTRPEYNLEDLPLRIQAKIIVLPNQCWEWSGSRNWAGYGYVKYGGCKYRIHRLTYSLLVGPIEDGLVVDHLCRNKACCNPAHLELVTNRENLMRGKYGELADATHCTYGHEWAAYGRVRGSGKRWCTKCAQIQYRRRSDSV